MIDLEGESPDRVIEKDRSCESCDFKGEKGLDGVEYVCRSYRSGLRGKDIFVGSEGCQEY